MAEWKQAFDVHDIWTSDSSRAEQMLAVASRLDGWRSAFPEDDELHQISEELTDAANEGDVEWFDAVWSVFYDWADDNRIWVKTF